MKSNSHLSEGLIFCNYFVEPKCIQEHKSVSGYALLDSVKTITAFCLCLIVDLNYNNCVKSITLCLGLFLSCHDSRKNREEKQSRADYSYGWSILKKHNSKRCVQGPNVEENWSQYLSFDNTVQLLQVQRAALSPGNDVLRQLICYSNIWGKHN